MERSRNPHYERRVLAAFRVLHPYRTSAQGSKAWFRREVLNRCESIERISSKTIGRWLTGETGMPIEAVVVIRELEAEAHAEVDKMRETIG